MARSIIAASILLPLQVLQLKSIVVTFNNEVNALAGVVSCKDSILLLTFPFSAKSLLAGLCECEAQSSYHYFNSL